MQKEVVELAYKHLCYKYTYINILVLLITLFQFQQTPLALPLGCAILNELIIWIKLSRRQIIENIDHILNIFFYIYIALTYYLELKYYIFSNMFVGLSFIFKIFCDKKQDEQHQYSTIIRLTKIFYRFSQLIAILCITLKMNLYVDWTWSQTFWWYWMFLSGLIGSTITFLLMLISKLIRINNSTIINRFKNEVKILSWLLYTSALSSLIATIWIVNTLNVLGINFTIKIGDLYMYCIISMNILIFCTISYVFSSSIIEFILAIDSIESRNSSPKNGTQNTEKQIKKEITKTSIFMQKLSNAYFRQIKDLEIVVLKDTNQNEILTERNLNNNIIQKKKPCPQNSNSKCIICCEKSSNAILMNCGHGGICYQCAMQLAQKQKECFLCRQIISTIYEIDEKDVSILKRVISKTRISN
ncbi:unnamed protein product [Paramecium sonneborni]|uniref:RING-type domain-containing protein n=1 Tax=Paramecium sonneborni TaxID=65129 RepID=A0A8S1NUK0_9CILI|nr:unnamed protein product [Paramecium sonneborni]